MIGKLPDSGMQGRLHRWHSLDGYVVGSVVCTSFGVGLGILRGHSSVQAPGCVCVDHVVEPNLKGTTQSHGCGAIRDTFTSWETCNASLEPLGLRVLYLAYAVANILVQVHHCV